jgi:adenylate cyclase
LQSGFKWTSTIHDIAEPVFATKAQIYLERYGIIPEYKAGVNGGEVIRAEIGDQKRDLIYNGDVLNTTARIQSECNRFNARLLIASELLARLVIPPYVTAEPLGDIPLKGMRQPVALACLRHAGEEPMERRGNPRPHSSHPTNFP